MISVLIPAYNEAEHIQATVTAVRLLRDAGLESEILVVDDGSTDATAVLAERAGADIVYRQSVRRGKGQALNTAFALAHGETLLLLDADLGASAAEASSLLVPVLAGDADMVIARFPEVPGRGGGVGLAVRAARLGIRLLTGRTMQAPLSGQRALGRSLLDLTGSFARGWGVEVALTVLALRAGARVQEIPTAMTHRVTGRDLPSVLHRAGQFFAVIRVLAALAGQGRRRRTTIQSQPERQQP